MWHDVLQCCSELLISAGNCGGAKLLQAKKDHGGNAFAMATALQNLFTYGWQRNQDSGRGGVVTPIAPSRVCHTGHCVLGGGDVQLPGKYRPPQARTSSSGTQEGAGEGSRSSKGLSHLHQESSDSESSDAEGGGGSERYRSSRVRSGALACLQLLAKADPKSLHGSWTALLPMSDLVGRWNHKQPGCLHSFCWQGSVCIR